MQNALRIGLVPQQTNSGIRLFAALPFFPDAADCFISNDVLTVDVN
jgi:hypothetical protein